MHLAAGGLIGRHPTAVQQLFAVVAGEAEVSGSDGTVRTIGPGYAALWEVGEEHNRAHLDHVLLRDLLRADGDARERYASLKRQNAALADGDMDVYVAAKHDLVQELLSRARDRLATPPEGP